ncbi:MAG: ABC transporter substrate-binding protein [Candidatus Niyogibacteria bacterium]|nr:ABC transporter substrate-binding protein [Candidatus Niyogibacteria bacterium]
MSAFARFFLLVALALAFGLAQADAKPTYVQSPPLTQVVKAAVGSVKSGSVQVPLITWGGDIATIHANGNALQTAPDSIFAGEGLNLTLFREDNFVRQVEMYLSGKTPYLRGTMGMITMASEVICPKPDAPTCPVVVYQMTWSAGGDWLVAKEGIKTPKDLKGKTIALQAYGPHVDYLMKLLADAGLKPTDVTIKWLPELTATKDNPDGNPAAAFRTDSSVDAAMVITPDALVLTSNSGVGTGSEDSVKGAHALLSTKTMNRIIADVYVVRRDWFDANRADVQKFVHGLLSAEEKVRNLFGSKTGAEYKPMITAAAKILLGSAGATADAEGLYLDCEFVGYPGNVQFFTDANYPRGMAKLSGEIQSAFKPLGLLAVAATLKHAGWDYAKLKAGLADTVASEAPRFDPSAVAGVIARQQQAGTLGEGTLFEFMVLFEPNQKEFPAGLYESDFNRAVNLAATYGGAIITIEGHSDPMGYLQAKKDDATAVVLGRIKQSGKNLSMTRAVQVRDSLIAYARGKKISLDPSQFATVGLGFDQPATGMCGSEPCPPKTKQEWLSNMRVVFRILQVEAEASVFKPLN